MADFGLRPVPLARTRSPRVALAYVSKLTGFTITLIFSLQISPPAPKTSEGLSFSFVADFGLRPVPTARTRSPPVALAYVSKLTGFTIMLISFATNLATSSKNGKHCLVVLLFTSSLLFLTSIVGGFWATPCAYGTNSLPQSKLCLVCNRVSVCNQRVALNGITQCVHVITIGA